MEFSLAGVSGSILSAFLVLNSDPSPNNTLETTFFHVTEDEDGVITANDFQSAAASTGIVQTAVLVPAEYSYDVTSFVTQDRIAGFSYSSYQGRVDEAADVVFRRGLEYLSNAPTSGMMSPRLVIETAPVPEPSSVLLFAGGITLLLAGRLKFRTLQHLRDNRYG